MGNEEERAVINGSRNWGLKIWGNKCGNNKNEKDGKGSTMASL